MGRNEGRTLIDDDEEPVGVDFKNLVQTTPSEWATRFALGAAIALIAGVITIKFGPRAGGLFLAFPAILPATLTLIEKKEGKVKAVADASGGILGAGGLACFALSAHFLLKAVPAPVALLLALVVWIVVSVGLYIVFRETGLAEKQDRLLVKSG
jgi:hypothetical protein